MNIFILVGILAVLFVIYSVGYWRGAKDVRKEFEPQDWEIEISCPDRWVAVRSDEYEYTTTRINVNETIAVRLRSGKRVLMIGEARVQDDDFDQQLKQLAENAEERMTSVRAIEA